MRIIQLNNYAYLRGGSEKVFIDTTNVLRENGHQVRCFSIRDSQVDIDGCTLVDHVDWFNKKGVLSKIKCVCSFIYNKRSAQELEALIKEFKPDVAHIHIYYGRLSNSIIRILRKYNIPIVQSVHEYRLICPAYTCLNNRGEICEKCANSLFKASCILEKCTKNNRLFSILASFECFIRDIFFNNQNNIDKFIMVSKFIKNLHVKYFPQIECKSEVLYNMIDVEKYATYRVSYEEKSDYCLYLGRLSYEKGLQTLLDSFVNLPNIKLKIAGKGPLESELKNAIVEKKLNNVELIGFLSGDRLYNTVAKAKFLIIPSEWYENNPISVIESLALGTPVIGSNIGGIPELVIDEETGFLHNPKDITDLTIVIKRALNLSTTKYLNLVGNGIKLIEQKSSKVAYYNRLINIYKSLC